MLLIIASIILSTAGCVEKSEPRVEMVLSNYPKLFEKDVIIVVGENATQVEMEGAKAIAQNLENVTGNVPLIRKDVEITEKEKARYNMILLSKSDTNGILRDVYEKTNATKVTDEYPGVGKGMLEILWSPWNEEKAILFVAGSDALGMRAGIESLKHTKENRNIAFVEWKDSEAKIIKFDSLSGFYNLSNDPIETAKIAMNTKYGGENWSEKYQVRGYYKYPSIAFNHWLVRITPPEFSILITMDNIYFLSPENFTEFLKFYGEDLNLTENLEVINLFEMYQIFYGMENEETVTEKDLGKYWTSQLKEKYNIEPKELITLTIEKEGSYRLLDVYTVTMVKSYPRLPSSPLDIILSHYIAEIGTKGDVYVNLVNKTTYKEVIQYE